MARTLSNHIDPVVKLDGNNNNSYVSSDDDIEITNFVEGIKKEDDEEILITNFVPGDVKKEITRDDDVVLVTTIEGECSSSKMESHINDNLNNGNDCNNFTYPDSPGKHRKYYINPLWNGGDENDFLYFCQKYLRQEIFGFSPH